MAQTPFAGNPATWVSYINSWNMNSLAINCTNFTNCTNIWVGTGSYPSQIGGYWYVSYNGPYPWSHFEAK